MEDGLGDDEEDGLRNTIYSLNPCFSGGWSRSFMSSYWISLSTWVLILVLVEDGLGVKYFKPTKESLIVLILVLVEDGLGAAASKYEATQEDLS